MINNNEKRKLIALLIVSFCLLGFISTYSFAQGILVRPLHFELHKPQDDAVRKKLEIENNMGKAVPITMKVSEFTTEQGKLKVQENNPAESGLADRISLSQTDFSIEANSTETIEVNVKPPEGNSRGPEWGCVEILTAPIAESKGGVGIRFRFIIEVLQFDDRITDRQAKIESMSAKVSNPDDEKSKPSVTVTTKFGNVSKKILQPELRFQVRSGSGKEVASKEISDWVLPGKSKNFSATFPAKKWKPGQYLAVVIADYGGSQRAGGQYVFEIPEKKQKESS